MDRYSSFAELSAHEHEGRDYRIIEVRRHSRVIVLAPHGGTIEPTTSQIATAIAGHDHTLYCFEGLIRGRPHSDLHLTSDCFDEPGALELVARATVAVAIHGRMNRDDPEAIWLGGLDTALITLADHQLNGAGFKSVAGLAGLSGKGPRNICNRTATGQGLQLELPPNLRDRLRDDAKVMQRFASAIRTAIARRLDGSLLRQRHS